MLNRESEYVEMEMGLRLNETARAISFLQDKAITDPQLVRSYEKEIELSISCLQGVLNFVRERRAA